MAVTFATITREPSGLGPRRKFEFYPQTDGNTVTVAAEDYEHTGPYQAVMGVSGGFTVQIPTGTDQGGSELLWKIVETPIDRIAGRVGGPTSKRVIGHVAITASVDFDDLIADLVDVTAVDAGIVANIGALVTDAETAATTATTKAGEALSSANTAAAHLSDVEDLVGAAEAVAVNNDTIMTGVDADDASDFRVQQDARLAATFAPRADFTDLLNPELLRNSLRGRRTAAELGYVDRGAAPTIADGGSPVTPEHQMIRGLVLFDGLIFLAHGDWFGNSGPCHVITYDPTTNVYNDEATLDTESFDNFVVIGNYLYALNTDPTGAGTELMWRRGLGSTAWTPCLAPAGEAPEHVSTLVAYDGALWCAYQGLTGNNTAGIVAKSLDDGLTWTYVTDLPADPTPTGIGNNLARPILMWTDGADLFVWQIEANGQQNPRQFPDNSWRYDGSAWIKDGPRALPESQNVAMSNQWWGFMLSAAMLVSGVMVYNSHNIQPRETWSLAADGTFTRVLEGAVGQVIPATDGLSVFVLDEHGMVWNWNPSNGKPPAPRWRVPYNARSFLLHNNVLYIGGADGHVYTLATGANGPTNNWNVIGVLPL